MPKRPIVILEVVQRLVVEWNRDAAIVKLTTLSITGFFLVFLLLEGSFELRPATANFVKVKEAQ